MNTYFVIYVDEDGTEKYISASYSDAYSFAQEMSEGDGTYWGKKVVRQGWK